jgi:hypothetical protein
MSPRFVFTAFIVALSVAVTLATVPSRWSAGCPRSVGSPLRLAKSPSVGPLMP